MSSFRNIFVTVGTTQFEELINVILSDEILTLLQQYQCKFLRIQYGAGKKIDATTHEHIENRFAIKVDSFDFKANIISDITWSDLVISHAGAGSCIEVLTHRKPLIVVVNDKLMHNHQTELAQQLFIDGHLLYCTPYTLIEILTDLSKKVKSLKPYEPGHSNMIKLVSHLNTMMGFEWKYGNEINKLLKIKLKIKWKTFFLVLLWIGFNYWCVYVFFIVAAFSCDYSFQFN